MMVTVQKERHRQHKKEGKAKVQRHRVVSDNAGESENVNDEIHRSWKQTTYLRKSGRT